jgi:hypothetical protein
MNSMPRRPRQRPLHPKPERGSQHPRRHTPRTAATAPAVVAHDQVAAAANSRVTHSLTPLAGPGRQKPPLHDGVVEGTAGGGGGAYPIEKKGPAARPAPPPPPPPPHIPRAQKWPMQPLNVVRTVDKRFQHVAAVRVLSIAESNPIDDVPTTWGTQPYDFQQLSSYHSVYTAALDTGKGCVQCRRCTPL